MIICICGSVNNVHSNDCQYQPLTKNANPTMTNNHGNITYNSGIGRKDDKGKIPMGLMSSIALIELSKVLQYGAIKYDRDNWRSGLAYSRVIDAVLRHLYKWKDGIEEVDDESGVSHLAHAMCGLMFLLEYIQTHPELDDRYKVSKTQWPSPEQER